MRNVWPLRTAQPNSYFHGFMVTGRFDSTNFIEYCGINDDTNNNCDYIHLSVSSFETDYTGTSLGIGVPEFSLLPCESLMLSIALQHQKRIDRKMSRCRNDYPNVVKKIVKDVLSPKDMFNAIFAPYLPYDSVTCKRLCKAAFWLPVCHCYMSWMSYRYAGSPANMTSCVSWSANQGNCTKWHADTETPTEVLTACQCFAKCKEEEFYVVNVQRHRYSIGM